MVYVSRFFVPASSGISAGDLAMSKRISKFNMTNEPYWTRSPSNANNVGNWYISVDGSYGNGYSYNSYGIRSALILPYDFQFTKEEVSA